MPVRRRRGWRRLQGKTSQRRRRGPAGLAACTFPSVAIPSGTFASVVIPAVAVSAGIAPCAFAAQRPQPGRRQPAIAAAREPAEHQPPFRQPAVGQHFSSLAAQRAAAQRRIEAEHASFVPLVRWQPAQYRWRKPTEHLPAWQRRQSPLVAGHGELSQHPPQHSELGRRRPAGQPAWRIAAEPAGLGQPAWNQPAWQRQPPKHASRRPAFGGRPGRLPGHGSTGAARHASRNVARRSAWFARRRRSAWSARWRRSAWVARRR